MSVKQPEGLSDEFDSYRFIDGATSRVIKRWIKQEPAHDIPWTPLKRPLSESTVALISSAGVALKEDKPFDRERERRNPWWGDPSYRQIPPDATADEVEICHLHIDPRFGQEDLDCIFPIQRLRELAEAGQIGRVAPRHYSTMGYILDPMELLEVTGPAIIRDLKNDNVDAVVFVPV